MDPGSTKLLNMDPIWIRIHKITRCAVCKVSNTGIFMKGFFSVEKVDYKTEGWALDLSVVKDPDKHKNCLVCRTAFVFIRVQ